MEQAIRLYDFINIASIEMLLTINGNRKYSLAQGQKNSRIELSSLRSIEKLFTGKKLFIPILIGLSVSDTFYFATLI